MENTMVAGRQGVTGGGRGGGGVGPCEYGNGQSAEAQCVYAPPLIGVPKK